MKRRTFLLGATAITIHGAAAAAPARSTERAEDVLRQALAQAAADNRAVLIMFFASWCSWCRVFDTLLVDPEAGPVIARHFHVLHMRAEERTDAMRALEPLGVEALFARYAKEGAGLPFFAVLDGAGRPVVTSIAKSGENIGYPVSPEELAHFDEVLRRGAPAMSAAERATVRAACVRHAPQRQRS